MSGMGGWSGSRDHGYDDDTTDRNSSYGGARDAYSGPAPQRWSGATSGDPQRAPAQPVHRGMTMAAPKVDMDTIPKLKSTAKNVLIIGLDKTGSMGLWPQEIVDRGEGLLGLMEKYSGTKDNQILVVGFGDGPMGDDPAIQVAPDFGSDGILAAYLQGLDNKAGWGNGVESSDLVLHYVMRNVDTSSASNVWCVIVTDEGPYLEVDRRMLNKYFGGAGDYPTSLIEVADRLRTRMNLSVLFCDGEGVQTSYDRRPFKADWQKVMGEAVIPIEYKERLVDTLLLVVANTFGQTDNFVQDFVKRQKGTQFGDINIRSMQKSVAASRRMSAGQAIVAPSKTRKSIIDI